MDLTAAREHAETAARAAGRLILDMSARMTVSQKGPADLLTTADPAAQELIISATRKRFPESTFLAEEDGVRPEPGKTAVWIIDPIDGTTNYVHGFPFFAVSIGLQVDGELVVGAIFDPSHGTLYSAAKGQGATRDGKPIHVSTVPVLADSLIATGFPPRLGDDATAAKVTEDFIRTSRTCHAVLRFGSAVLSLAYLAAGQLEGVYATTWKPWDCAGGVVVVREAGGVVTNRAHNGGAPPTRYDVLRPDIVASNGLIHGELLGLAG